MTVISNLYLCNSLHVFLNQHTTHYCYFVLWIKFFVFVHVYIFHPTATSFNKKTEVSRVKLIFNDISVERHSFFRHGVLFRRFSVKIPRHACFCLEIKSVTLLVCRMLNIELPRTKRNMVCRHNVAGC